MNKTLLMVLSVVIFSSCSLLGIQNEESPKYEVLEKDGNFEIRKYSSYIVAETMIEGNYDDSSGKAFKILAGYIFGKNKGEKKIAMTSPVAINQTSNSFTMSFSMPSKYTLLTLPEPLDKRIQFKKVSPKIVAVHSFTWLSSKEKK